MSPVSFTSVAVASFWLCLTLPGFVGWQGGAPDAGADSTQAAAASGMAELCKTTIGMAETIKYYDFHGIGMVDADRDLRRKLLSVSDHAGRLQRFAGQANWSIDWQTCLERQAGACRVAGVTLKVDMVYTLPRWADRNWAPEHLQARWDGYAENLLQHEKGHGDVALEVAHDMERQLVGLTRGTCEDIRIEAHRLVARAMRHGELMQKSYDRRTGHGVRQGAVFPFQ